MEEALEWLKQQTKEDVISQMEALADSFTPEWNYNEKNPDVGSALVNIYADMYMEMQKRYKQIQERDRWIFFQQLGILPKGAEPAKGYVSFGIIKNVTEGIPLPAGTCLLGNTQQGETVKVETQRDIYISDGQIQGIYYADGDKDTIFCLATKEGTVTEGNDKNLQEHSFWLEHSTVFAIADESEIMLSFRAKNRKQDWNGLIGDREKTEFSYISARGEWKFTEWSCKNQNIRLKKTKEMPEFAYTRLEEQEGFFIRWKAKDVQAYDGFEIEAITLGALGEQKKPELVYTEDREEGSGRYFPFGERPFVYGEYYICSDEVFGKKEAEIRLKIDIEFRRISQLVEPIPIPIQWKTIMKQSDFQEEPEIPITIGEVVWEYYNGIGFTRLFSEPMYSDVFTPKPEEEEEKQRRFEINFRCPSDIQPFLVNAKQTCCIRVRILRMNHAYVRNGYYLTPFITHMEMSYDYGNRMQKPEICGLQNQLEWQWTKGEKGFVPFFRLLNSKPAIYIGFQRPLREGPYGLYCKVNHQRQGSSQRKWTYEYFNGRTWKNLVVEDGTEGLTKDGVFLLYGNDEFASQQLFGQQLFWLRMRILETSGVEPEIINPIQELWWNTVPVLAVQTQPEELLYIDEYKEYPSCRLKHGNIQQITVWVKENETWSPWEEVEEINESEKKSGIYKVNRQEGILTFCIRERGSLPDKKEEPNVKVRYTWGGGTQGNVHAGEISQIDRSIRFLNQIVNHAPLTGGKEPETEKEAIERSSRQLLHQNRAVMASDYEALAYEAARDVVQARAFPNRSPEGNRRSGAVTLVVLQEHFLEPGEEFQEIKECIYDYIEQRGFMGQIRRKQFFIIEPWLTQVQVSVVCVLKPHVSFFICKAEAEERLETFLHPLTGNFDGKGWDIGQAPKREQIRNVLREISGIEMIKKIVVKAYCNRDQKMQEIDLEGKIPEYLMIISGKHKIQMELDE